VVRQWVRIPRDREVSDGSTVEAVLVVAADGTGSAVPECPDLTRPLRQASRLFATGVSFPAVEPALSPAQRRLFRRRGSVRHGQDGV